LGGAGETEGPPDRRRPLGFGKRPVNFITDGRFGSYTEHHPPEGLIMRLQELREAVGRRPFVPFRVVMTDGANVEVRHPELCMLGEHGSAIIGVPSAGSTEPLYNRHVIVDISHIVRLEPQPTSVSGNGSAG
jgi:hypothetical protein